MHQQGAALDGLLAFTHGAKAPAADRDARAWVTRRLETLHRSLVRDAKRFDALGSSRQHRVSKRLKRLRYLSEFASPQVSTAKVAEYLHGWGWSQDALGECNDHRIATDSFHASALGDPAAKRAVRWLKGQRGRLVEQCQRALREASRKSLFWRP